MRRLERQRNPEQPDRRKLKFEADTPENSRLLYFCPCPALYKIPTKNLFLDKTKQARYMLTNNFSFTKVFLSNCGNAIFQKLQEFLWKSDTKNLTTEILAGVR